MRSEGVDEVGSGGDNVGGVGGSGGDGHARRTCLSVCSAVKVATQLVVIVLVVVVLVVVAVGKRRTTTTTIKNINKHPLR